MMKFFAVVIAFVAISANLVEASKEIQCEVEQRQRWNDPGFSRRDSPRYTPYSVCLFKENVVISDPDTKLTNSRNDDVTQFEHQNMPGIEYLPTDIGNAFPNLGRLGLHQSSLKALYKKNLHGLSKLSYLSVSHNQISSIDEDAFEDLTNLFMLYLQNNRLTSLPPNVFSKLTRLDSLNLDNNQLTSLHVDTFKNNQKLGILILNGNKLSNIAPEFFSSLAGLRQTWLHDNELTSLNSEWFKHNPNLGDINVEGNKITEIPLDFLSALPSLRSVSFSNNPLTYVDFAIFENNPNMMNIRFNGIKFNRVLNIDVVDKMKDIWGIDFEINEDSCIIGKYHGGNLDKLKQEVKENCKTE